MKPSDWLLVGYVSTLLTMLIVGLARQRRSREDRLDTFTADAAERDWRFTTNDSGRGHRRLDRWESSSGGWTAESDGPVAPTSWNPRVLRWCNGARDAPGPSGPVVVLLDADVKVLADLAATEGRLATFAARRRVARAFKKHFGEALPLGGRNLQQVEVAGAPFDRIVVISDQADEAARRLTPVLVAAIRQVWSVWADLGVSQPWVGLCGDRIVIACVQQRPADVTQVAALVEIGSALAAARG
jgi:hypothetical protein